MNKDSVVINKYIYLCISEKDRFCLFSGHSIRCNPVIFFSVVKKFRPGIVKAMTGPAEALPHAA